MNEAPGQYLANIRMAVARELLGSGNLPVAEVAARTGYGTQVAFSRAFKRRYGASPSRFPHWRRGTIRTNGRYFRTLGPARHARGWTMIGAHIN